MGTPELTSLNLRSVPSKATCCAHSDRLMNEDRGERSMLFMVMREDWRASLLCGDGISGGAWGGWGEVGGRGTVGGDEGGQHRRRAWE